MKIVKNIILYVLAIYFVLQGAYGFAISPASAIVFFVCALLTFPFMHKIISNANLKKGVKDIKGWIYIIVVMVLFILGWVLWPPIEKEDAPENSQIESESKPVENDESTQQSEEAGNLEDIEGKVSDTVIEEIVDDGIVAKLIEFGFTEAEASEMRKVFIQCGVQSIDGCEPTDPNASIDNLVSFRDEWDKDRVYWFTVDKRQLIYMSLNGTDVYDIDKGGFLINVNDVHVPETSMTTMQKDTLLNKTEAVLDEYFKYTPYYDAWGFAREDDNYMVQCEAYAKNDLGVKKYLPCRVWYTKSGEDYKVTGVSIDGKQYEVK